MLFQVVQNGIVYYATSLYPIGNHGKRDSAICALLNGDNQHFWTSSAVHKFAYYISSSSQISLTFSVTGQAGRTSMSTSPSSIQGQFTELLFFLLSSM